MKFLKRLVRIYYKNGDLARKELILNNILVASIASFIILNIIRIIDIIKNPNGKGMSLLITMGILIFFIFLLYLSKKGFSKIASIILILVYAFPTLYSFYTWGADLPAALLLTVLLITMSGALLNAYFVYFNAIIISLFLLVITYLQENNLIKIQSYWRQEYNTLGNTISYIVILLVIATIAWLFAKEIKTALKKLEISRAELQKEHDLLEIKVEERTKKIKKMRIEKINQLYRLAEFGKLSSGIFHDLINPLTAVSINLEQVVDKEQISNTETSLQRAILATRRIEGLVSGIKKQLQKESNSQTFSIINEIEETIQILSYKARKEGVIIKFNSNKDINIYGSVIKFNQVISNIISNAIEAYHLLNNNNKIVKINIRDDDTKIIIKISDNGCGIKNKNKSKIFEPFFSTKKENNRGLGIGLSSSKYIIEKHFKGKIIIITHPETTFKIHIPYDKN